MWCGVEGHDEVVDRFRRALARGRLASSFLFVGPPGVGKRLFAERLAQTFLCSQQPEELLAPCGSCPNCRQVLAGSHPDLEIVVKPEGSSVIPVELFIGRRQHRMQEGLCHAISLKPMQGRRKVAIIDDADFFNEEGANCLLKTLEEPPPRSVLILVGASEQRQLPTIRSRCQTVRFGPLEPAVVAQLLVEQGEAEAETAQAAAALAGGSLAYARRFLDPELLEFRELLYRQLQSPAVHHGDFPKTLAAFVEAAGKEAPLRRARMREIFRFAAEFYRHLLHAQSGSDLPSDTVLQQAIAGVQRHWRHGEEAAALALECCLSAEEHVFANANQTSLLEWWVNELTVIARSGAPLLSFHEPRC
ncbi:DNA polymerase III subunit delta' [Lignipirellula cremea]|uniref:DNA polymerase III subunit tau n=1 Tax=Lignipirellula cremea TaxID=2528010 RepID=A0A518DSK1_9BACT|nr:DNA polymerase III subunit delta' [Lignipirellula cremea]QDU94815.1 DNA polymerase III subunit tau [Lignipirellula cremea]